LSKTKNPLSQTARKEKVLKPQIAKKQIALVFKSSDLLYFRPQMAPSSLTLLLMAQRSSGRAFRQNRMRLPSDEEGSRTNIMEQHESDSPTPAELESPKALSCSSVTKLFLD
jgi:hypothetical protein